MNGLKANEKSLCICVLGTFSVEHCGQSPLRPGQGMGKIWNVFKYLITHRDRSVPIEMIVEVFWPGSSFEKARQALYNSVYRLRGMLHDLGMAEELFVLRDGMYQFNRQASYWLDAEAFEDAVNRGYELRQTEPEQSREWFRQAMDLYRGDYLSENLYDDWVKAAQNRYRRLFEKAALTYCEQLLVDQEYTQIQELCQNVLQQDPLNEDFQIRLMRAYIEGGKLRAAREQYQQYSAYVYRESGIVPSQEMRTLYRNIQGSEQGDALSDLETIHALLDDPSNASEALFCAPESFRYVYNIERSRTLRSGNTSFLVKVSVSRRNLTIPRSDELKPALNILEHVLLEQLRGGDIACHWVETQFLLIIPCGSPSVLTKIQQRIENAFRKRYQGDLILSFRHRPVAEPSVDANRASSE